MPIASIPRDPLFAGIGKTFTEHDFEELCFEFGIELDEVVEEEQKGTKTRGVAEGQPVVETVYKIEVPANRYDLLCLEGMVRALGVFIGTVPAPSYTMLKPPGGKQLEMIVESETAQIRPFVVCAVLRNCTFSDRAYNSFLDLQDKLHHNVCRRRTLVAIGTHDLATLQPPFRYRARAPKDINFVPLAHTESYDAEGLFAMYEKSNSPIKKFLPIISSSPVYPVIYDAKDRVLSLPPIINGEHSRISADTKDVLIECTATDMTKAHIVLNTVVAMFSEYSATKFSVEPVTVTYQKGCDAKVAGTSVTTPDLTIHEMDCAVDYIHTAVGLTPEQLPKEQIPKLLTKMMVESTLVAGGKTVRAKVPITRSDIMHACDLMEDVAVAFSFNKIPRAVAPVRCLGAQQPLQRLTDLIRNEICQAGWTEALTFALCSHDECFSYMRREDDGKSAAVIANPKTAEFQICRTSLLPGLFKTLGANKSNPLPWRLFEVSDTTKLDPSADTGASNRRRIGIVYSDNNTSGFEILHGLVERVLMMLGVKRDNYGVRHAADPSFFDGRCAEVFLKPSGTVVGLFGTVHPEVLGSFELPYPASAVEMDLQAFLALDAATAPAPAPAPAAKAPAPAQKEKKEKPKKEGGGGGGGGGGEKKAAPSEEDKAKAARDKLLAKVFKEGGKKGVEIEGASDMGGLDFFCTTMETPDGDLDLLELSMEGMNAQPAPDAEDRKGCSGHVGKMTFSAGVPQLALCAYVPDAEHNKSASKVDCKAWMEHVLKEVGGGEIVKAGPAKSPMGGMVVMAKIAADPDKGKFPLKDKDASMAAAFAFLRSKGAFPEDNDDSDDEMIFGDDCNLDDY